MKKNRKKQMNMKSKLRIEIGDKTLKSHPDGGWGWCVVIAAFWTQFVIVGLQNSSGVIFNELVEKYNRPRGETGFVSSISCGMMFLFGPLTTSLCQKFGCRIIAIAGGFFCMLGMVASAYAQSLQIMYITFGLTWGLGTSFCYFPTLIILVPYFNKRLALVNGIVSAGSGTGTLILSPFIQWFSHNYGVKKMFLMLAALHGIAFCAGFVYRPISDEYKRRQGIKVKEKILVEEQERERQDTQETLLYINSSTDSTKCDTLQKEQKQKRLRNIVLVSLFKSKAFNAWCLGLSVFILGYFVPFVHIVRYAKLIGIPEVKAAFLISILSIVATIFKVISGKVAGMVKHKLRMYQVGLLIMGVATTLIPVSHSYVGLVIYAVVFGISESMFIVMIPIITKEIVGVQRLPLALGCVFMLMGIPTVVGAPIAGWIYDAFSEYSYAFYVAGSMNILGVLIMFLVVLFDDDVTKIEKQIVHEDDYELPNSRTLEFTSFASSERIFYSQMDLLDIDGIIKRNNNNKFYHSNTSIYEADRIFKGNQYLSPYSYPSSWSRSESPSSLCRPEPPSLLNHIDTSDKRERRGSTATIKSLSKVVFLWRHNKIISQLPQAEKISHSKELYVVDSTVTTV